MDLRQEIEKTAYEIYKKNGCVPGQDIDHWLEAERIVYTKFKAQGNRKAGKVKAVSPVKAVGKKTTRGLAKKIS
jgi:hypothetical protein